MGKKQRFKFEFGTDFQELILQYTVTDREGYKALELYEDSYFTLIPHTIIAYALKKYYKKEKHVPEEAFLREYLRVAYQMDKVMKLNLSEEDKENISNTVTNIYSAPIKNPGQIVAKCISFARFVRFKTTLEEVDIENYDNYEKDIDKLRKSINIGADLEKDKGIYLVKGMKDRAHKRDTLHKVTPTPFWQMNQLLNPGGTEEGNVIIVMAKEKFFKTGFLINLAKGYLRMRMKGFYADLENGQLAIVTRTDQSMINAEQTQIQSGEMDDKLLKLYRKYARIGSELAIRKFPNLKTSTDDLQAWLDELYMEDGFKPDFGIIDYGLLMASTSGKIDELHRISEAHLDMKNFATKNKLGALWSAAHITRDGNKRVATKFQSTDIAKNIDIAKHVDALLGLQQNQDEQDAGVMRMEVVEQRNGMREGKMLFWVDIAKQRMKEFTKGEVKEYKLQEGEIEHKKPIKKSDL